MSNQQSRSNRVRYTIYGNTFGSKVIDEPNNWYDDQKELLRSEKFFGIMANMSNSNLEFYGLAYKLLKSEYDINGIKAVVRIEREERNENTDIWGLTYSAFLDFKTYSRNKKYVKLKLNESKLFNTIESRFKDAFELERLTDLKGGVLPPLEYKKLRLKGRNIFRESLFDSENTLYKYIPSDNISPLNEYWSVVPTIPKKYSSDEKVNDPTITISTDGWVNIIGRKLSYTGIEPISGSVDLFPNSGQVFYLNSNKDKTINIDIKIDMSVLLDGFTNELYLVLSKHTYQEGEDLIFNSLEVLGQFDCVADTLTNHFFDINLDVDLLEHQCLCLSVRNPNRSDCLVQYNDIVMKIEEDTISETTDCEVLTYYQVFERLIHIITGQNYFQSNLLSNKWKDLLFTSGFKIRQVPDKSITTSLEEVYNSLNSIDDIALFINGNIIKVEEKSEAFIKSSSIDLGRVVDIDRQIEEKHHYSTIEIGCDFNGLYEEVVGLDEYNIRNTYTTCLDELDNKFPAISKVRFDSYGMTLAQEKQYVDFPKLDTKYDKYNFGIDAKTGIFEGETVYFVRIWTDDFEIEPTGIYSVLTAFNLRLSPFNSLLRKSKTISTGLQKYPTQKLQYANTEGNSQLVTIYPERANVENSILLSPYFLPESITFSKKISMAQFKQITDNPYKLIKFVNEYGNIEYGFIYPSVKPNKEGKFVLIKANI